MRLGGSEDLRPPLVLRRFPESATSSSEARVLPYPSNSRFACRHEECRYTLRVHLSSWRPNATPSAEADLASQLPASLSRSGQVGG